MNEYLEDGKNNSLAPPDADNAWVVGIVDKEVFIGPESIARVSVPLSVGEVVVIRLAGGVLEAIREQDGVDDDAAVAADARHASDRVIRRLTDAVSAAPVDGYVEGLPGPLGQQWWEGGGKVGEGDEEGEDDDD